MSPILLRFTFDEAQRLQAQAAQQIPDDKKGITDESVQQMEEKLNLM